jgi:hypothetical protein
LGESFTNSSGHPARDLGVADISRHLKNIGIAVFICLQKPYTPARIEPGSFVPLANAMTTGTDM